MACDPLVRTRPKKSAGSIIDDHKALLMQLHQEEFLYGITITFSDKARFDNPIKREGQQKSGALYSQSTNSQFLLTNRFIQKTFKEFHFILYEEYTRRGIIHYHGVIWHPLYKVENSRIKASIFKKLRRCGKANLSSNSLQKISSIESWTNYILKEQGYFVCNCPLIKDPLGSLQINYERDTFTKEGPTFVVRKNNSIYNYLNISDSDS